jgi:hypothetical protein
VPLKVESSGFRNSVSRFWRSLKTTRALSVRTQTVCWTLDALFNGLAAGGPRLLFKGGTSLSKGYGLISRFSEDIDITVFREDIGQAATVEELEGLSSKKRAARLNAIREACQNYINGPLLEHLSQLLRELLESANLAI